MSWRLPRSDFERQKGAANKNAMKKLVARREQIGIIAYADNKPIGWCAVGPRENYIRLENSRVLKRIDDKPVWSVTCFFILKECRRKGISVKLLEAVIDFCRRKKAYAVEAYPIIPYDKNMPAAFAWTGILSSFTRAGFVVVKRWSKARPIVRFNLQR